MMIAGVVLGWTSPAGAHASLTSAYPSTGAHLDHAPTSVSVAFDQPVKSDNGGLVVLDSNGNQVNAGASSHVSPTTIQASLRGALGDGAYVANYTVTSVDGHVVSGGIVFLVGHATAGQIGHLTRHTSSLTGLVDKFGQFLTYVGILAAGGLAFFLAFILRQGPERRRLRRWCVIAASVGIGGLVVTAAAQVALTGGGWRAIAQTGVDQQVLAGKFGAQCALQIVGLAACLWSTRLSRAAASQSAAFYGLLVSAGAFVMFGHAIVSPEKWLSIPADCVHAVFAAMWIGGIAGLIVVLRSRTRAARLAGDYARTTLARVQDDLDAGPDAGGAPTASHRGGGSTAVLERSAPPRRGSDDGAGQGIDPSGTGHTLLASTVEVVSRFSTMAGVSAAALMVAGTLLAVAEVGSVTNLFDTTYGQLLLVKVAVVGLLVFMAAYNRLLLLPILTGMSSRTGATHLDAGWRRLLATVRVEAMGLVAVLAVTAVLANSTPSNGSTRVAHPVPFSQSQSFEGGHLSLHITPNQALVNNFVAQFTGSSGAPEDMAESVSVYLTLPSENVGPIVADMHRVGIGKFVLVDIPAPPIIGNWQITLQIQVSAFDQLDAGFVDNVQ